MLILLAAALSIQAPEPTPEDTRTAMAWGACMGLRARQFAARPDADAAVASAVVAACADLERGVAAASIRMAGREGGDEAVRRLHADANRRALAYVREARGAPPPTGRGAEFQVWGRCVTQHLIGRADGRGTPEEIVQAAEGDCTAEREAARAAAVRDRGTAVADARIAQIQTQGREYLLQLLTQIRASHEPHAPAGPEPR